MKKIPIPRMLATRPVDHRGYPIPFLQFIPETFYKDRRVDFRITDPYKKEFALRKQLCGLCGQPLAAKVYFIGGPLSAESRVFSDPPMHRDCAQYAMKVCPYLVNPNYKPAEGPVKSRDGTPTQADALQGQGRPPKMFLYKTNGYNLTQIKDGRTGKIHSGIYAVANPPEELTEF
jgi:hypothetical protein